MDSAKKFGQVTNSSSNLLERLRSRESLALEELVEMYGDRLSAAAYNYLNDRHLAEDVTQETFIAAWDAAARTNEHTFIRSWLFAILFNQCRKKIRSLVNLRKREEKFAEQREESYEDEVDSDHDDRLNALQNAMQKLDGPAKEIVILRFSQQCSVKQTSEILNIPEGTVKSRTSTALTKLKRLLGENS